MDARRLGLSAAGIGFASGTILALFEVQGWTIPEWLAVSILIALIVSGVLFAGVLIYEVGRFVASISWPRPNLQWKSATDRRLIGHARRHIDKPIEMLPMLDRRVLSWDFNSRRPRVTISVTIFNGTQFKIYLGAAQGHPNYAGDDLADAVESSYTEPMQILSGNQADVRFTVYIPDERKDELVAAISNHRLVQNLSLKNVKVPIEVSDDWLAAYSTEEIQLSMGDEPLYVGSR